MTHRAEHCLNCGAPTPGPYCSQCGQRNSDYRESFRELVGEVAEEIFQFDSRIGRTVVPFLVKPGFLTKELVEGRRMRYSSPWRLFLFMSALYLLAVWAFPRGQDSLTISTRGVKLTVGETSSDGGMTSDGGVTSDGGDQPFFVPPDGFLRDDEGKDLRIVKYTRTRMETIGKEPKAAMQRRLGDYVTTSLPKAMVVLVPIAAAILALFFRKRFYFEHLIFVLHLHAFFFLLLALSHVVPSVVEYALIAIAFVYTVLALKRVYANSWPRLAWKVLLLSMIYVVLLSATMAVLAFVALEVA